MSLAQAQAAFRQSPSRATALAYMDAAIEAWWEEPNKPGTGYIRDETFHAAMEEIRDWLMNVPPEPSDLARMVLCQGV